MRGSGSGHLYSSASNPAKIGISSSGRTCTIAFFQLRVRPQTRGTAMNPVDHPHGGGEGSTTPGRHPVTPWGVPTLGYRTRKKRKASDRDIVRGRRRGKKR